MINNFCSKKVMEPVSLAECINIVNQDSQSRDINHEVRFGYQEESFNHNERVNTANVLTLCNMYPNIDHFKGISVGLTNICRMCGNPISNGMDIFTKKAIGLRLKEKIELHASISINPEDALPQKICTNCFEKLETTHSMVVTCLQTDLRLRKILNITSKQPVYDSKYSQLMTMNTIDIANRTSLGRIDEYDSRSDKIEKNAHINRFDCKWKDTSSNIDRKQIESCLIGETSGDNASVLNHIEHSNLNILLQVLEGTSPKTDESETLEIPIIVNAANEENTRLVYSNCDNPFETEGMFENHRIMCNSDDLTEQGDNSEFQSSVTCSVCRNSFANKKCYERHKSSCDVNHFQCENRGLLLKHDKTNPNIGDMMHKEKSHSIESNRLCGYCPSLFKTHKELHTHVTDSHNGLPVFKCSMCEKSYEKWSSLCVHKATHRNDKPYLCDLCGKSFKHSNNLRGHKRIHLDDAKKKRHVCDICNSAFRSRFHLCEHMNQHNGNRPYNCEKCGKAFFKRIQLRQHRLSHGSKNHACPVCGVTFNRRGNMSTHLKRHNQNEGMYTCSVCNSKWDSMSELKRHRKKHSENEIIESIKMGTADKTVWQCSICVKIFPKRTILLKHERTHNGDHTSVECEKCGKKLANKSSLNHHNKTLHSTQRSHMCQFCGEAFVLRESLLIHERIHKGQRPYTCKICNTQYRCSSNLSQHMKIHLSVRPHVCQYCKKTFTRKGALNVHERIHTGFKPFTCNICSRAFSQKNDMIKHTKTHPEKTLQDEKCDESVETKRSICTETSVSSQGECC